MRTHPGIAREARAMELQGERESRDAHRRVQLEQAETAAVSARDALEHPAIKAAFAALDARYVTAWRDSAEANTEARERAYYRLSALTELRAELRDAAARAGLTKRNYGLT